MEKLKKKVLEINDGWCELLYFLNSKFIEEIISFIF